MTEERKNYLRSIWKDIPFNDWYRLVKERKISVAEFIFLWKMRVKNEDRQLEKTANDFNGQIVS